MLTENVTVIGPRRGAENIKSASAADGETLGLKNAAASGNLGLIEPSIWGSRVRYYRNALDGSGPMKCGGLSVSVRSFEAGLQSSPQGSSRMAD